MANDKTCGEITETVVGDDNALVQLPKECCDHMTEVYDAGDAMCKMAEYFVGGFPGNCDCDPEVGMTCENCRMRELIRKWNDKRHGIGFKQC